MTVLVINCTNYTVYDTPASCNGSDILLGVMVALVLLGTMFIVAYNRTKLNLEKLRLLMPDLYYKADNQIVPTIDK
jgi:hypothetical protein